MIHSLEKHLGKTAVIDHQPAIAADMQDTAANITKANQLLAWQPEVPPEEGFMLTAEWHREYATWLDAVQL